MESSSEVLTAEVPVSQTPTGSVWFPAPLLGPLVESIMLHFCGMVSAFMGFPKHSGQHVTVSCTGRSNFHHGG